MFLVFLQPIHSVLPVARVLATERDLCAVRVPKSVDNRVLWIVVLQTKPKIKLVHFSRTLKYWRPAYNGSPPPPSSGTGSATSVPGSPETY